MIKNLFASLFVLLLFISKSNAQFEKGKTLIGISSNWGHNNASTGISSSSLKFKSDDFESESTKNFNLNFSPRIGRMFTQDAVAGIELTYTYGKVGEFLFDGGDLKVSQIAAGPFVRYYIPSKKIRPIIEVGFSFGEAKNKFENSDGGNSEFKSTLFSYGGGVGIAVPLGSFASFDSLLSYNHFESKDKEGNPNNSRSINNSLILRLGFSIYLGKNKQNN